ncbi:MAG: hypothetical protein IH608_00740, partial [Proteobacteria bacterium]|nr:hypothetical protein [Pseudomonadota bacterium]
KYAGYDHLVVTGRADRPTVVSVADDRVSFLDAGDLWGRDVFETTDRIWAQLGERTDVTCIGPAGENRVYDAALITNKYAAFARAGMGAVLGSKNCKAIAVSGSKGVRVADRKRFLKVSRSLFDLLRSDRNLLEWRRLGTLISLETFAEMGLYAKKNFQSAYDSGLLEHFGVKEFAEQVKEGDVACMGCPVGCKHHVRVPVSGGTEVRMAVSCMNAVMQSFGTFCALESWPEVVRCADQAVRMGLDFMSTGSLISFVMELQQRGVLTPDDTDGLRLEWGDGEAIREMIRRIGTRQGFGERLAEGLERATQDLGPETAPYAMHSKGLGLLYDPRVRLGSTEIFSQFTNVRGYISNVSVAMVERTPEQIRRYCEKIGLGAETIGRIVSDDGYDVGRLNKWTEDVCSALELLGVCMFPPFQRLPLELWAEAASAATGTETSADDLVRASENLWHARRAYNIREGAGAADDTCPERFFTESVPMGSKSFAPLSKPGFQALVRSYYAERGWDEMTGEPPAAVLRELGLLEASRKH